MAKVNPKIDLVFKKLFGVDKNKDLLISFINSVLADEDHVSSIILKNPYNLPDYLAGKISILDIKAEDDKGRCFNIEMQIVGHDEFGSRSLFYLAKAYVDQLGAGERYADLNKTIVINIVDFDFFKDSEEIQPDKNKPKNEHPYHREIAFRDVETHAKYAQLDYFSVHFIELRKYVDDVHKVKTTLERWISFLNRAWELDKDTLPGDLATTEIKKAIEELNIMYLDSKEKEYYEGLQKAKMDEQARLETAERIGLEKGFEKGIEKGIERGIEKGLEKGIEKGILKEKQDIAKIMKRNGEPVDKIMLYSGLSKEEIEKI